MTASRALAFCLLTTACSAAPKGPVAPTTKGTTAVADDRTWMTLSSHGARLKAPVGWRTTASGTELRAEPSDGRAVLVLDAAATKPELEAKLRALGARYGLDRIEFGAPRQTTLNGIPVVMFEDMAAESKGAPVDVFVLLGPAPAGNGILFVFLWASDLTQKHDLELIAAANTLRPL